MPICIEIEYRGYEINIAGIRRKFLAKNMDELHAAVEHYFNKVHDEKICPLCK